MRILLDECLPRALKRELTGHTARTVTEMGWSGTKNGALLRLAQTQFDVFLTVDRNIPYQQNLVLINLALIVLHTRSNDIDILRPLMPQVLDALQMIQPGQVVDIGA